MKQENACVKRILAGDMNVVSVTPPSTDGAQHTAALENALDARQLTAIPSRTH